MFIRDISLAKKLTLGFGIVLIMLGGIVLFDNATVNFSQYEFTNLLENDIAINSQVDSIHLSLLQLRRREKDFLLRNKLSYVQQHQLESASLEEKISALDTLAFQNQRSQIITLTEELAQYAEHYRENFSRLVKVKQSMGLDKNSGLQGEFRREAHLLSEALAGHNVADLYQQFLILRRWEKDFVRTKDDKYKQRLLLALRDYKTILELSHCEINAKQAQQNALEGYTDMLAHYLNNQESHNQSANYDKIRAFAHQMEAALVDIFIQNGQTLALQIRRNEKDYLLRGEENYILKTHDAIQSLKKEIADSSILKTHSLKLITLLDSYENAFNGLVTEDKLAATYTKTLRGAAHKMAPVIETIKNRVLASTAASLKETLNKTKIRQTISLLIGCLILIIGLLAAIIITRSISQPINAMMKVVSNIARGDLSQYLEKSRNDEIGELANSINLMVKTLNDIADQADAISSGDFSVEIVKKSKADRLAISLDEMKNQITERTRLMQESEIELQAFNKSLVQQNAFKTELSKMAESNQGGNYLEATCDKTISALAKMTGAGHGALYVADTSDGVEGKSLILTGSYALKKRSDNLIVPLGTGLAGQCAKEQQPIILTQVPGDYIYIHSALGEQRPFNIMLAPVVFEQRLIAVIELASFNHFDKVQQDLLHQVSEYIGFTINNIINQQESKRLLQDLQSRQ